MTNYAEPALTPNTMTVLEITGDFLARVLAETSDTPHTLRLMVEVEPNGETYLKVKGNEGMWSPAYNHLEGAAARVERLYDPEHNQ